MNIRIIATLGCAMALAGALSARAAGEGEADAARDIERQPVQVAVKVGDLDLASQEGSATMLRRLSDAALQACGASSFSLTDYRWALKRSDCYRMSMGRAIADLGAPKVRQLYEQGAAYSAN